MQVLELKPTNGQKSFNGKAKVLIHKDKIELLSYETIVAQKDIKTNVLTINGKYSRTTNKHIKAFESFNI